MTKFFRTSMFVIIAMSFLLAACGGATPTQAPAVDPTFAPTEAAATMAEPTTAATEAPAENTDAMYAPDAVSGDIVSAGSSTVFPLSERMKQRFEEEGFSGNITIDSVGTGAGFERFCTTGETDISNASRPIKETEAELAQIFSTATNWSDVRPDWPNEPIQRFSPGTDSGTFDYFVEAVMGPANLGADGKADLTKGEAAILDAKNVQLSEDDNVLVQGVEGSQYAIGYFGYAYYQENADRLNILSVEGVAPTAETAESGEYPLARPLFIYSDASIMQDKPQVASFILFYLENVGNEILDVGYFPISDAKLQEGLDAWHSAVGE